jgi:ribonucleoside-diphosphate reductase beta chain
LNKYCLFPIKNNAFYQAYKTQEACFWPAEEIDFSQDPSDFQKFSAGEQHFLKYILAFFAQSDGIVGENLAMRFYNDVDDPSAKLFWGFQLAMEGIHSEVYSIQIDAIIKSAEEKDELFNAIERIPCIKKKADWAMKWISSQESLAKRLFAFAVVEGVFFSGAFCSIFWLRKRGLMPGLATANDLIARDEGQHCEFNILVYKEMNLSISEEEAHQIISEALEIEKEFITEALPVSLIGMNDKLMKQYLEYVADRLLIRFGFKKIWNSENPFEFMKLLDMEGKTNFFEKKVTEYQKAGVASQENKALSFDLDF